MARSASQRWSKRTKPTPFERPAERDTFELETSDFSMWSDGGDNDGPRQSSKVMLTIEKKARVEGG